MGLWVFSIDKGGPGQDWRELEPIRRLDDLRFGRTQRYALRERAAEMPGLTDGGTGLYDTALAAYREAVRYYRPHYSNAVVLMTDGRNEDPGSISLDRAAAAARRSCATRTGRCGSSGIAISGDADLGALRQMARVTGGEAYLAAQPEDVLEVFAQAVLSPSWRPVPTGPVRQESSSTDVRGHAGRLVVALDLDRVLDDQLLAGRQVADLAEAHVRAEPAADGHRAGEAHLLQAVVEPGARGLEREDLRGEVREQAQGQEAVRDGGAERARARRLDVDVDPLVVEGGVGEGVDAGLVDRRATRWCRSRTRRRRRPRRAW